MAAEAGQGQRQLAGRNRSRLCGAQGDWPSCRRDLCITWLSCQISLDALQVTPVLSYGILLVNVALYAAGITLRYTRGDSSSEDFFYLLVRIAVFCCCTRRWHVCLEYTCMLQALQNSDVLSGQYYRCGVTAAMPGGACQCCCIQ